MVKNGEQFKVGDRVRTVGGAVCGRRPVGSEGTVVSLTDLEQYPHAAYPYYVEFDETTEFPQEAWNMGDKEIEAVPVLPDSEWWTVEQKPSPSVLEALGLELREVTTYEIRRKH